MFKKEDWRKFEYPRGGIVGEITIRENGKKTDHFIFNDSNGFKRVLGIMKKYGFNDDSPDEVAREIEELNKHKGFLSKDMEW